MDPQIILKKIKCCSCEGSLENSKHVNMIFLLKSCNWEMPSWGNVIVGVWGFACAVICDKCVKEKRKPKFAVEWTEDLSVIKYHPVKDLEDISPEFSELLDLERRKVAG